MPSPIKVKPCPFCGGIPGIDEEECASLPALFRVVCERAKCSVLGVETDWMRTRNAAVRRWNRRAKARSKR